MSKSPPGSFPADHFNRRVRPVSRIRTGSVANFLTFLGSGGAAESFWQGWRTRGQSDGRFSGRTFPNGSDLYAVFFYLRYPGSYRDLEEIMEERGVDVDHGTMNRWVIKFAPLMAAPRRALIVWVRCRIRSSRTRNTAAAPCVSSLFAATKRPLGDASIA